MKKENIKNNKKSNCSNLEDKKIIDKRNIISKKLEKHLNNTNVDRNTEVVGFIEDQDSIFD